MKIGKQYTAHKVNTIDIYHRYKDNRGDFNDGVELSFLEQRVASLENGRFNLAVAGEVKAGKSSFINALLGCEILPSDVLQASSTIVEICKSQMPFLKVTFANDHVETIQDSVMTSDASEAQQKLQEICKLKDEFREIPTPLIDSLIIQSESILEVSNELVENLEQGSSENLRGKEALIAQYIAQRPKEDIPVKIEFGYPLPWDFDELRVIDSPGVNATGGVQDVSFKFFETANAILFVHPIKPVESESFKKFVKYVISNRSRESLFLILTHAGMYDDEEVNRLYQEAVRLYSDYIPKERILAVDSVLKLIYNELENGIPLKQIREAPKKKKALSSSREQAEDEDRELIDVVYENSRFDAMTDAIEEFSMKIPNLRLQEILGKIKEGYFNQETYFSEQIALLEGKKENPQKFAKEINELKKSLDAYTLTFNRIGEEAQQQFTGRRVDSLVTPLKNDGVTIIQSSGDLDQVRKNTLDAISKVQQFIDNFEKRLIDFLQQKIEINDEEFKKQNNFTVPKIDLHAVSEKAKQGSYEEHDVYKKRDTDLLDWCTFGISWLFRDKKVKTETEKVYNKEKHISGYKVDCATEFEKIANIIPSTTRVMVENCLDIYKKNLKNEIDERKRSLDLINENKQLNDEIITDIQSMNAKKKIIKPQIELCDEILEDLR